MKKIGRLIRLQDDEKNTACDNNHALSDEWYFTELMLSQSSDFNTVAPWLQAALMVHCFRGHQMATSGLESLLLQIVFRIFEQEPICTRH